MNNYKIKVNGTHPLEYQDILDVASELGYDNEDWGNLYNVNYLFLNDDGSVGFSLNGEAVSDEHQELTLPQLRDLVAKSKNEQGLISGADAKLAWAKGENVQFRDEFDKWYQDWTDLKDKKNGFWITDFDLPNHQFRLKPRTIKLELEIPAPFEPKDGDDVWFIDPTTENGYHYDVFGGACKLKWIQFGAWRTEEEIKQVVAAWRGGIKG